MLAPQRTCGSRHDGRTSMRKLGAVVIALSALSAAGIALELLTPAIHRVGVAASRAYGPPHGRALLVGTWAVAIGAAYYGLVGRNVPAVARLFATVFAIPAAMLTTFLSADAYRIPDTERGRRLSRLTRILSIAVAALAMSGGAMMVSAGSGLRLQGFAMVIFGAVFAIAEFRGETGPLLGSTFSSRKSPSDGVKAD